MAEKKPEFQVVDKRKFTSEGEVRPDTPPAAETAEPPKVAQPPEAAPPPREAPPTHSSEEHAAGREAYATANKGMDAALQDAGIHDFQVSFERFLSQLYMAALYHLGMLREEGVPARVDLVGARQTIDTIEMLAEKTKGNLTEAEARFVKDRLYELHMAYLEVTQAIAQAPGPNAPPPPGK